MANINGLIKAAQRFVVNNSPAILTGIGVTGTIATAVLAARASFKAAEVIQDAQKEFEIELSNKEKLKTVWPLYIPAVGTCALTAVAIIGSNRIGARRTAALAVVYTTLEKGFEEYKGKISELYGAKKEQAVRDTIAQDRVTNNPPDSKTIIVAGSDSSVLCLEDFTGRYFLCDMETLRKAENDVNRDAIGSFYVTLTEFYEKIGLPATAQSDYVGWNTDYPLELTFSATLTDTGKPCMVVGYRFAPRMNFNSFTG